MFEMDMWNCNFITEIWKKKKKTWFLNSAALAYSKEIEFNCPLTDTTPKCQVALLKPMELYWNKSSGNKLDLQFS